MAEEPEEEQEQKGGKPDWYYNTEPVEAKEDDIIEYQNSWKNSDGSKMSNYVAFEQLKKKEWVCRVCMNQILSDAQKDGDIAHASTQFAASGGIQVLESGRSTIRQGLKMEGELRRCETHGMAYHDRWTGFFTPNFSASIVPQNLQEKIFEMANYKDVVENEGGDSKSLMVDHKFPRGEFHVHDDIPYKEILKNLESNDEAEVKMGEDQCKKYFQVLKKSMQSNADDAATESSSNYAKGNHNKMKAGFCSTCCTCPACERELSDHTNEELTECSSKPTKTPESRNGKRGMLFGIKFWYNGTTEDWPKEVPRKGIEAEIGCEGCGWYDVAKWREELNKKLMGQ